MDNYLLYTLFKFLHIAGAMAWIGGGVTLFALSMFAMGRKDEAGMLEVLKHVGVLATRWFVPASLITLVCGLVMAFVGNLWSEAWVVLGLVGFAATFVTGHFGLRPFAEKIFRRASSGDISGAVAEGRGMLQVSKFDYTMLFLIVADMVLKPQWNDFTVLAGFSTVLVAAVITFLGPLLWAERTPSAAQ
ncbi:MAG TPA: DUF2269 family protein [Devosia sp.]|nr:DUF2269 family protein [Devosia sp.]